MQLAGVAVTIAAGGDNVLHGSDELGGSALVSGAVLHGIQPLLAGSLNGLVGILHSDQLTGQVSQTVAGGLLAQIHAKAVLSVILEQGGGKAYFS